MSEKSGLDMLEELVAEVKRLNQKVSVMDQLLKKVANSAKISELATKALDTPLKDWARSGGVKQQPKAQAFDPKSDKNKEPKGLRFNFESNDAAKIMPKTNAQETKKQSVMCMCEGKMVANSRGETIAIPGIDVSIFNDKDEMVKKTRTNRAGAWLSQLPPGKYVALCEGKFQGKPLHPVNIKFEVKPGMEKLEVS